MSTCFRSVIRKGKLLLSSKECVIRFSAHNKGDSLLLYSEEFKYTHWD